MSDSSSAVEIDFFRLKEESSPKKLSARRSMFILILNSFVSILHSFVHLSNYVVYMYDSADIQDVISKINPDILKPAIASAFANNGFVANKSFTSPLQLQTLPVYNNDCGGAYMTSTAPLLTIIYNGNVSVFDVSPNQADNIMKLAESANSVSKTVVEPLVNVKSENNRGT